MCRIQRLKVQCNFDHTECDKYSWTSYWLDPIFLQDVKNFEDCLDEIFEEVGDKDLEIEELKDTLEHQKFELDRLKCQWAKLMESESLKRRSEEIQEELKRKVPKILETKFYSPQTEFEKLEALRAKNDEIGLKAMGITTNDLIAMLG